MTGHRVDLSVCLSLVIVWTFMNAWPSLLLAKHQHVILSLYRAEQAYLHDLTATEALRQSVKTLFHAVL